MTADEHLPHALRILARDIHCEDGIATQCIREAADEIDRLRSNPCPYVTGSVTRYCTLTPFTLTDAEREAIDRIAHWCEVDSGYCREAEEQAAADHYAARAATLRKLLERTVEK